jgi:hypothetical protein
VGKLPSIKKKWPADQVGALRGKTPGIRFGHLKGYLLRDRLMRKDL